MGKDLIKCPHQVADIYRSGCVPESTQNSLCSIDIIYYINIYYVVAIVQWQDVKRNSEGENP